MKKNKEKQKGIKKKITLIYEHEEIKSENIKSKKTRYKNRKNKYENDKIIDNNKREG